MAELISTTLVITRELRVCLEKWAQEDNRSMSYILRDILKRECDRRIAQARQQQPESNQQIR